MRTRAIRQASGVRRGHRVVLTRVWAESRWVWEVEISRLSASPGGTEDTRLHYSPNLLGALLLIWRT